MKRIDGAEVPNPTQAAALNQLAAELLHDTPHRLVIAGGPRAGKSVLSSKLGVPVFGSDTLLGLDWSEASRIASLWLNEKGPWVCEGVVMPRALRKWLARVPTGKPADVVIWLGAPVVQRTPGQQVMARGCETVWHEIRRELVRRGTRIRELNG